MSEVFGSKAPSGAKDGPVCVKPSWFSDGTGGSAGTGGNAGSAAQDGGTVGTGGIAPDSGTAGTGGIAPELDAGFTAPPESMRGGYDLTLSGYWEGTCNLSISETEVSLTNLRASASAWQANIPGPKVADTVAHVDGAWVFVWDMLVPTNGIEVRQVLTTTFADSGITESKMDGTYVHTSALTGTHDGTVEAVREGS